MVYDYSDSSDDDFELFEEVESKILDAKFGLKIDLNLLLSEIQTLKPTKRLEKLVIPFLVKLLEKEDERNEMITKLISKICGRISQGNQTSSFTLNSGEYILKESSYTEAEIGFQTWGAGILLAKMIDLKEIDVEGKDILELGSGTGLAGLVCARMGARQVVMTDYHPVVIDNANINIKLNNLEENAICVNLDWRWSLGENVCSYLISQDDGDESKLNPIVHPNVPVVVEKHPALTMADWKTIIAADCVFDLMHSALVPKVAMEYLSNDKEARFHVVLPHRLQFKKEVSTFEKNMILEGWIVEKEQVIEQHAHTSKYYIYKKPEVQ